MNQQTKDQIAREAEKYSDVWHDYDTGSNWEIEQKSYITGAETWAERGEVLKEALEEIRELCFQEGDHWEKIHDIALAAVTKFNNSK